MKETGQGSHLGSMTQDQIRAYARSKSDQDFFQEYIMLSKEEQLYVFTKLDDDSKKMIYREYEQNNASKANPFYDLQGEVLEDKYFSLSKEDQAKAWANLDENQRKHVWSVYESRNAEGSQGKPVKNRTEGNTETAKQNSNSDPKEPLVKKEQSKSDKIMSLAPAYRKPIIAGFTDEALIEFYDGITVDQNKLTFWGEISDMQKQVITSNHEVKKREKMLKDLEGIIL
jgi:hypothetical protein